MLPALLSGRDDPDTYLAQHISSVQFNRATVRMSSRMMVLRRYIYC